MATRDLLATAKDKSSGDSHLASYKKLSNIMWPTQGEQTKYRCCAMISMAILDQTATFKWFVVFELMIFAQWNLCGRILSTNGDATRFPESYLSTIFWGVFHRKCFTRTHRSVESLQTCQGFHMQGCFPTRIRKVNVSVTSDSRLASSCHASLLKTNMYRW